MDSLPMQTVLIADDHEIVRHAVRMIIEALPGNFEFHEAVPVWRQRRSCLSRKYNLPFSIWLCLMEIFLLRISK